MAAVAAVAIVVAVVMVGALTMGVAVAMAGFSLGPSAGRQREEQKGTGRDTANGEADEPGQVEGLCWMRFRVMAGASRIILHR